MASSSISPPFLKWIDIIVELHIRPARPSDAPQILAFITELADYERARQEVTATVQDIERTLFVEGAAAHALICSRGDQPIGFALYFFSYSTWLGRNGLYLEDLYISPEHRGVGAGKLLLQFLAREACNTGCGRFEWSVLDWNEPAIQFYQSIGAKPQPEWVRYRMEGDTLNAFAGLA
nr:GNAT family N-acetyltransferase [Pseudomonas gingeri]